MVQCVRHWAVMYVSLVALVVVKAKLLYSPGIIPYHVGEWFGFSVVIHLRLFTFSNRHNENTHTHESMWRLLSAILLREFSLRSASAFTFTRATIPLQHLRRKLKDIHFLLRVKNARIVRRSFGCLRWHRLQHKIRWKVIYRRRILNYVLAFARHCNHSIPTSRERIKHFKVYVFIFICPAIYFHSIFRSSKKCVVSVCVCAEGAREMKKTIDKSWKTPAKISIFDPMECLIHKYYVTHGSRAHAVSSFFLRPTFFLIYIDRCLTSSLLISTISSSASQRNRTHRKLDVGNFSHFWISKVSLLPRKFSSTTPLPWITLSVSFTHSPSSPLQNDSGERLLIGQCYGFGIAAAKSSVDLTLSLCRDTFLVQSNEWKLSSKNDYSCAYLPSTLISNRFAFSHSTIWLQPSFAAHIYFCT